MVTKTTDVKYAFSNYVLYVNIQCKETVVNIWNLGYYNNAIRFILMYLKYIILFPVPEQLTQDIYFSTVTNIRFKQCMS